jgi:pimeloyl-ACP methyl ester carboxylesterase
MLLEIASFLIKISPENIGYAITKTVAAKTQRPPISKQESGALGYADKIHYGKDNRNIAWSWGEGPIVIFVHGWGGQAAQLAPLALQVAKQGFRAIAIDVSGHGDSPGKSICWEYFLNDIAELSKIFDKEIYAYVAHSAGALSMMAARKLRSLHASRYVCICAPTHPYPPIDVIRRKLKPSETIIQRYKAYIANQFESTWADLEPGISHNDAGPQLLLFYDEADKVVNHIDGDKIKALNPNAVLIKTSTYSHTKILLAPELHKAVIDFIVVNPQ